MADASCHRLIRCLALLTNLVVCEVSVAQDVTRLYPPDVLNQAGRVYARNIQGMWQEDFIAKLQPGERDRAGSIILFLPPVGANRHPLEYYSEPASRRVFLPISSVKFLDDLSIAFAYYQRQGCDLSTVSSYAALLKKKPAEFADPPLQALAVPDEALEDSYVDDVSQKLLKSTLFFLASHEYAHVMYGHRPYADISPEQAQAQEIEADAFALDVMRRIAVAPMGMSLFFMVSTGFEAAPQDFQSNAEYRDHLEESTHPIGALRIDSIAANIEDNLADYANAQDDPASYRASLTRVVSDLRQMARDLADDSTRTDLASKTRDMDAAALASSCKAR